MADAAGESSVGKGGGLLGVLIPVVVLTILAAGGGGLLGNQFLASIKAAPLDVKTPPAAAALADPGRALKEMTPIVTNLAEPDNASWIRLQGAIVYDKADAAQIDVLSAKIGDDVLALLRTLTLADLQGATGLEILREDLSERASIRSDGHVREVVIEMMVVQ